MPDGMGLRPAVLRTQLLEPLQYAIMAHEPPYAGWHMETAAPDACTYAIIDTAHPAGPTVHFVVSRQSSPPHNPPTNKRECNQPAAMHMPGLAAV